MIRLHLQKLRKSFSYWWWSCWYGSSICCQKRGHEVVLCEKSNELGGQLRLVAVPIAKQELCKVIKFMIRRLDHEGIEIRLNTEVTKKGLKMNLKITKSYVQVELHQKKFHHSKYSKIV